MGVFFIFIKEDISMEITKHYPEEIAVLQAVQNLKIQADKLKRLVLAKKGKRHKWTTSHYVHKRTAQGTVECGTYGFNA